MTEAIRTIGAICVLIVLALFLLDRVAQELDRMAQDVEDLDMGGF